jgi:hypothetical protein
MSPWKSVLVEDDAARGLSIQGGGWIDRLNLAGT